MGYALTGSPTAKSLRLAPPGSRLPDDMASAITRARRSDTSQKELIVEDVTL